MTEKRKYRRLRDGLKVIYKLMGVKGEISRHALDMGGGGIQLVLNQKVPKGTLVEMSLNLNQGESFFCLGKVAWQADEKSSEGYNTGIEFLQIDLKRKMNIINYIFDQIRKKTSGEKK